MKSRSSVLASAWLKKKPCTSVQRSALRPATSERVSAHSAGGAFAPPISATVILAEIAEDLVRAVLADHPDETTISLLAISVSHLEGALGCAA
jgi:hypothetical protein